MAEMSPELRKLLDELRRERDELRVKLHLAKADAKDEWDRLEHRWAHLLGKLEAAARETGKTAVEVGAALRLAAEELRKGYQRVRDSL
jgi:hypothetical protein